MKTRLLFVPLLIALVCSLAACGGGGSGVPSNAVAVVGNVPITIADFNTYLQQAAAISKKNGVPLQPGTPQYDSTKAQVIAYLVQINELEQMAPKEHVSVSQAEVTNYLTKIAKDSYGGSMAKLTTALKQQGLSMATARQEVYVNLLAGKIHKKVTKTATVSVAQLHAYYTVNLANYKTPASTTRAVEYILVKSKALADTIEQKLHHGASFESMAKKYSTDTTTAPTGGKFTVTKGGVVPAFQAAAFALKTGQTSGPVDATSAANKHYGWFIVKALARTKNVKAHTTPFPKAEATIRQTLVQQQVDQLWAQWLSDLKAQFASKVSYGSGYEPPTTTALPTTT